MNHEIEVKLFIKKITKEIEVWFKEDVFWHHYSKFMTL